MNLRMYVYRGQIDSPLTWPNNRIKDSRSDNKINNLGLNFFFLQNCILCKDCKACWSTYCECYNFDINYEIQYFFVNII